MKLDEGFVCGVEEGCEGDVLEAGVVDSREEVGEVDVDSVGWRVWL